MTPRDTATEIASELVDRGALAVVLMGSHARGDAMENSDIDLIALGDGPEYRLERRYDFLISISWIEAAAVRLQFKSPRDAPGAVPGWRTAVLLADRNGIARDLQQKARDWTWKIVGDEALHLYVAEEITGLAEEVHKLVGLSARGNLTAAAVQRSILSFRLGVIMAVHCKLMFETENSLWDLVNERLGTPWSLVQARAFGLGDESFFETCIAALDLYRLAVECVAPLLNARQRAVVCAATALRMHEAKRAR